MIVGKMSRIVYNRLEENLCLLEKHFNFKRSQRQNFPKHLPDFQGKNFQSDFGKTHLNLSTSIVHK